MSTERQELGVRLRKARWSVRLTIRDVAQYAKVSFSYLCKVESGKANPTMAYVEQLMSFYGDVALGKIQIPDRA